MAVSQNKLKRMINKLYQYSVYCELWNVDVNMSKSEVMIMKRGGGAKLMYKCVITQISFKST